MLLISAVNADPCLSVEVITHKLAGCYQSGGVTKHTVIPLNACTPIANFASVDVSLKTNCVPPGYTCNLVVFNSNTCSMLKLGPWYSSQLTLYRSCERLRNPLPSHGAHLWLYEPPMPSSGAVCHFRLL
jgi:hypothetical protein